MSFFCLSVGHQIGAPGNFVVSPTLHLERHGNQWRVRLKVPAELVPIMGRTKLIRPLHVDNLKDANERKWAVVAALKGDIADARKALASGDPITREALQYRLHKTHGTEPPKPLADRVAELAEARGGYDATVDAFEEIAGGASTPLDHHLDAFITAKGTYTKKSQGELRRVVVWLADWLKAKHKPQFIEDVDRRTAGAFIDGPLTTGRSRKRAILYVSFLRQYWDWLMARGHLKAEVSPWERQKIELEARPKAGMEPDGGKRPYTDDELAKLIYGPAPAYLPDLMRIAALTGMRIEEICQLRVRDCAGGTLSVHYGKTDNARRTIPIHPDLKATIEARCEDKAATDYLFGELPPVPKSREGRSDPAVKRFTRYRRDDMKVDERPNGKAKSNVDFHSFRRWFVLKARDAMHASGGAYEPWTLAEIVGHDDDGVKRFLNLTMSHYPGAASEAAKRACVEAVKLPPKPSLSELPLVAE